MTSSSSLTRYQGPPSQDKGIRSSNQDQCIARNATIALPRLHHNCQIDIDITVKHTESTSLPQSRRSQSFSNPPYLQSLLWNTNCILVKQQQALTLLERDLDSLCTWSQYQNPHLFLHLCCHDQEHYSLDLMVQLLYCHLSLLLIVDKNPPIGTAHH